MARSEKLPQTPWAVLLPYFQVDAFASTVFCGNPAGVVVSDQLLTDAQMLQIAEENRMPETAFVRLGTPILVLRWFTPVQEVPFCGHATLAAAHILFTEYNMRGVCTFQTEVGLLKVESEGEHLTLEVPALCAQPAADFEKALMDLTPGVFLSAFRNFENLFVELRDEEAVRAYQPDLARISGFHPLGLAITARGQRVDFVSRYFAPSYGIPEDAVTGSTHATLVPFWADKLGRRDLVARQLSPRVGEIVTRIARDRVRLSGRAATFLKGTIYVTR